MSKEVKNAKPSPQRITIGNSYEDADLIKKIIQYQKEHNLSSAAAAVRSLCEDALTIKKALR